MGRGKEDSESWRSAGRRARGATAARPYLLAVVGAALLAVAMTAGLAAARPAASTARGVHEDQAQQPITLTTPSIIPDSWIPDSTRPDSNVPDAEVPDAEVPDADVPDEYVNEADLPGWLRARAQRAAGSTVQNDAELSVRKSYDTDTGEDLFVANGGLITYTIVVTNNTDERIRNITLLDSLPRGALQDITCLPATCQKIFESSVISEPLGGNIEVTETTQISWTITLPPSSPETDAYQVYTTRFRARVAGQTDGSVITNRAIAIFELDGDIREIGSNQTSTSVQVPTAEGVGATVSTAPTWFSSDQGGTIDLDWGDFDRDGDLDLVLASSVGTTVYRNNNGSLARFWGNTRRSFGVQWGDFNGDGRLQIVAVGEGDQNAPSTNYVYHFAGNTFQESGQFESPAQLVRVATGDFDGDGDLDLVVGTNAINADCPVVYYVNDGAGQFSPRDEDACISRQATASIRPGDFDQDGYLDLVVGRFPNSVVLLRNDGTGNFSSEELASSGEDAPVVEVDANVTFLPYDFAWGDFNQDGFLDLAAGYPLLRQARVYRNDGGEDFTHVATIPTNRFLTPYSVDWGDFTGDGQIDLAVADLAPTIYTYTGSTGLFQAFAAQSNMRSQQLSGQVWKLRGADVDNDGDLDLTLTDRNGPSLIFTTFAPMLSQTLRSVPSGSDRSQAPSSSVTWGDLDGNGYLDLLFGGGPSGGQATALATKIYLNQLSTFDRNDEVTLEGFGPHPIALGDVNRDGQLDVAIGTNAGVSIYLSGNTGSSDWTVDTASRVQTLAWADYDDDQDLDLLAGTVNGAIYLYCNAAQQSSPLLECQGEGTANLSGQPVFEAEVDGPVRALAWADLDGDHYPDFVAGVDGGSNAIFHNQRSRDGALDRFTRSSWTPAVDDDSTRDIALVDVDGDGDLDLAVANYGTANLIYENDVQSAPESAGRSTSGRSLSSLSAFSAGPVWSSADNQPTTSMDWADWDNDGDLDLAIGNDGQPDRVYLNRRNGRPAPGTYTLSWVWTSSSPAQTTDVGWGDADLDGDLDLAISRTGSGTGERNGYYENTSILPVHLSDQYEASIPLPNNPVYLSVDRPGTTPPAALFSMPERVVTSRYPTTTITFRVHSAGPRRAVTGQDVTGSGIPLSAFRFAYSTDGGGSWQTATPATPISPTQVITPTRMGAETTFVWDAQADQAISDQTLFRVSLVQPAGKGNVPRGLVSATSPPFRVRGTTCEWPGRVHYLVTDDNPLPGQSVQFTGVPLVGSGSLQFRWNFGDGASVVGQRVNHTFAHNGTFTVRLTISGTPCPINRSQTISFQFVVGDGISPNWVYMPFVANGSGAASRSDAAARAAEPAPPDRVTALSGAVQDGGVTLSWDWGSSAVSQIGNLGDVTGYRVYRSLDRATFEPLARVPAGERVYEDTGPTCGAAYFVTAVGPGGESPASAETYVTPACDGGEGEDE